MAKKGGLAFLMVVILLVVVLGTYRMIAKYAGWKEMALLFCMLFFGFISLIGASFDNKKSWWFLSAVFTVALINLLFVHAKLNGAYFKRTVLFAFLGLIGMFTAVIYSKPESKFRPMKQEEEVFAGPAPDVEEYHEEKKAKKSVLKTYAPGKFVASNKGAKFHAPKCDWAKKISLNNQVWFKSKAEAKKKGYKPCGLCVKKK